MAFQQSYPQFLWISKVSFKRIIYSSSSFFIISFGVIVFIHAKSPRQQGLLPKTEQGRQVRLLFWTISACFWAHPINPQQGWVAPQTLTTRVPTNEARCILALSIDNITSSFDISDNSSCKLLSLEATQTHCVNLFSHS